MKSFATVFAIGLLAAVQAQEQCASIAAKIPSCATQCIDKAAGSVGCSSPTDFACQCKNSAAINAAALNCVLSGCGAQTGLAVQASASAVCDCVATAASSPSSPSTAEAAVSSSPAAASAVPTAPGPEVSAGNSAVITASSSAPFPTASQISDGQVQASGASSPTGATSSNTTVPFTGAGNTIAMSAGLVLLSFGAAIAAL